MKSAYNHDWVYHLAVIKEAKRWWKREFINKDQFVAIAEAFKIPLYHPNLMVRVLLFVATLFALSGVSGFFFLVFANAGETIISIASILYGLASFFVLEKLFIKNNHYKSGVTEALLYHACGITIGGIAVLTDMENVTLVLILSLAVFSFAAIRYLDLICTTCATLTLVGFAFYECFIAGGIFKQVIPFVIILLFLFVYWQVSKLRKRKELKVWEYDLIVVESLSLLLIYLGGNYFVVRELSVSMMDLDIAENGDIPFAFIFYFLTAAMPVIYLYFAIKARNVVLLRVSLVVIALSAFTFKYYFSLGHPEITLTVAGALLL
ncbi:MAG TPA: hypothetical protein VG737_08375, partial [Cyclobacteriaceae bacterium]|nr:hypothetical protein [Cyclobacteriaceae bacterium]